MVSASSPFYQKPTAPRTWSRYKRQSQLSLLFSKHLTLGYNSVYSLQLQSCQNYHRQSKAFCHTALHHPNMKIIALLALVTLALAAPVPAPVAEATPADPEDVAACAAMSAMAAMACLKANLSEACQRAKNERDKACSKVG
jgi:hypothetical protein